jgi:hypothetical protein
MSNTLGVDISFDTDATASVPIFNIQEAPIPATTDSPSVSGANPAPTPIIASFPASFTAFFVTSIPMSAPLYESSFSVFDQLL